MGEDTIFLPPIQIQLGYLLT